MEHNQPFDKILVALDTPELSDQLVAVLEQLQIASSVEVILVHVVNHTNEYLDEVSDRPEADTQDIDSPYADYLPIYQSQLQRQVHLEVTEGDPADEIIRLANIHKTTLIVMGSRGLSGLNRILKGSVSSEVVANAPCSVLVLKSQ